MLTERLTMKTLNALVIKGPGPRTWGARGPTLRAALKLTKCMANILCVKLRGQGPGLGMEGSRTSHGTEANKL